MNMKSTLRPLAATVALLAAGSSHAAIQVFTDEDSFLAALAGYVTDSFDDLVPGASYEGPWARSAGDVSYTVSASPNSNLLAGAGSAEDGRLSSGHPRDFITFAGFGTPILGIGAYVFGSGADGQPLNSGLTAVRVRSGDDKEVEFEFRARPSNYFGFLSDAPITSLEVKTFGRSDNPTWPTVDDLTLAPVPEPGSWALMALGIVAIGGLARRRLAPRD